LAFLNADSRSSSGFHTLGTPVSSYRNRSSNVSLNVARTVASDVCSASFRLKASHVLALRAPSATSFSSGVQL
jgi:hypothetical protein